MKQIILRVISVLVFIIFSVPMESTAGGTTGRGSAPLDETLMSFKEQGVWYFLCTAPVFNCRIPPHYLTYGPPPPEYCPPPPAMPLKSKICPVRPSLSRPRTILPPTARSVPPPLPGRPQ